MKDLYVDMEDSGIKTRRAMEKYLHKMGFIYYNASSTMSDNGLQLFGVFHCQHHAVRKGILTVATMEYVREHSGALVPFRDVFAHKYDARLIAIRDGKDTIEPVPCKPSQKPFDGCFKVDLSWLRGKAREVVSAEIQKELFARGLQYFKCGDTITPRDLSFPYLIVMGNKFAMYSIPEEGFSGACMMDSGGIVGIPEISANNALEGKYDAVIKKPQLEKGKWCLVRDHEMGVWQKRIYVAQTCGDTRHLAMYAGRPFSADRTCHIIWHYAIPYKGNEHFEGTCKSPE